MQVDVVRQVKFSRLLTEPSVRVYAPLWDSDAAVDRCEELTQWLANYPHRAESER